MENNRYREEEKELNEQENSEIKEEIKEEVKNEPDSEFVGDDDLLDEKQKKKAKKSKLKEKDLEIEKLKQEVLDLKDQLLRQRADVENFKKRINEEKIRDRKYALQDFLMELIDIVDIFDQAVNVKTDDEKLKKFLSGFLMVNKNFKQVLEKEGVKPIDALDKDFDPLYHSAIETVQKEGVSSGKVVEVVMTGYTYKDRVLRPSMVKVSE